MEILCLSAETNLTIITIAVSVIGIFLAALISIGVILNLKKFKKTVKKDIDERYKRIENILLFTYNSQLKDFDKETPYKKMVNSIDELDKKIEDFKNKK